ncbi:helix-turn-helix domain-containing protein [Aequorivita flava]|uniref:Helix-turn-helix transcriptional regulator n=1 Tax=Aequorivita flava TaxID=3114371 RepID=A0AB35YZW2_9FLAO
MMLKELLKSKGVKQKWLAKKIGVSEVTLSNWVKDKSHPSKGNLKKLSEALNIDEADLIN